LIVQHDWGRDLQYQIGWVIAVARRAAAGRGERQLKHTCQNCRNHELNPSAAVDDLAFARLTVNDVTRLQIACADKEDATVA
jgi:hypothetical protein